MRWRRARPEATLGTETATAIIRGNVAPADRLDHQSGQQLAELTISLVRSKRWEAVGDIVLDDEIVVTIAANAAIPILRLGLDLYRGVGSILVRPTTTTTDGLRQGPVAGVYTDHPMAVIGQALPNRGPISLSWDAALVHSRDPGAGRNVVIHEFAHKIDMMDGYSDGIPPLRGAQLTRWTRTLDREFAQGGSDPSDEVLSPYAWTNTSEFFAVATEAFFCSPHRLGEAKPDLYAALAGWYLQDPAGT